MATDTQPNSHKSQAGRWRLLLDGNPAFIKWSVMIIVLLWVLVYKISESQAEVGGFVYANF